MMVLGLPTPCDKAGFTLDQIKSEPQTWFQTQIQPNSLESEPKFSFESKPSEF